jgi:hypothetical protein
MRAELSHADLESSDLQKANLTFAKLEGTAFDEANLEGATLANVDAPFAWFGATRLSGACFRDALLLGSRFTLADLRDADLTGTDLSSAVFDRALLEHCDFTEATLDATVFEEVDLSKAKGIMTINHGGRSVVDFQTIHLSKGQIPTNFLRGVGLPDNLIEYLPSLIAHPVQFYSCFISYSTDDQDFSDRLYADLQNNGVRCWFAPHDAKAGRKLHEQIDEAIRMYDRLLLILSEHSMDSEWVKTEIANARKREIGEKRQILFPIGLVPFEKIRDWQAFDADIGKDSAREIREYFIPDFSDWKNHKCYQKAFSRLLRDLKAEPPRPKEVLVK